MAIIKAGTYRFNDDVELSLTADIEIPFVVSNTTDTDGTVWSLSGFGISTDTTAMTFYGELSVDGTVRKGENNFVIYSSELGWEGFANEEGLASLSGINFGQYITVTEDTDVSDETAFTWFTSSTTMLIKAGTYKWNDVLTELPLFYSGISINFTTKSSFTFAENIESLIEAEDVYICNTVFVNAGVLMYYYVSSVNGEEVSDEPLVYSLEHGWNAYSNDLANNEYANSELANGFGQIITITEDTYVPTNFGTWFNANTIEQRTVKGVWLLNEVLTFPDADIRQEGFDAAIDLTIVEDGVNCILHLGGIQVLATDQKLLGKGSYTEPVIESYDVTGWSQGYSDGKWRYDLWGEKIRRWDCGTKPQYVSIDFYNWLIANACPVIKGVWLFNETPELTANRIEYINFSTRTGTGHTVIQTSTHTTTPLTITYHQTQEDLLGEYTNQYNVYYSTSGWSGERRIAFDYEQGTSVEFYEWFTASATDITEDISYVNYGEKCIAVLEDGERVTLSCEGLPMTANVSILAHSAPILTQKEITQNGEYSARADNAKGYSVVTVNVPVPEGEINIVSNGEYDVSGKATAIVDIPIPTIIEAPSELTENRIYTAAEFGSDGISKVAINVPIPDGYIDKTTLVEKIIDANGTYSADEDGVNGYSQVIVDVPIPEGYIKPNGTLAIDTNGTHDVADYANAEINIPTPTIIEATSPITANGTYLASQMGADGISKVTVNVSGNSAECSSNHIIEVELLPSEPAEKKDIYKLTQAFSDVILAVPSYGIIWPFSELAAEEGAIFETYTVYTKPTEDIKISSDNSIYAYYVEDEDDIFLYGDMQNVGSNEWISFEEMYNGLTFKGFVGDISEITADGYYAIGGTSYWQYFDEFVDIVYGASDGVTLSSEFPIAKFYRCNTKPVENIVVADLVNFTSGALYYIEDENDIFVYGDPSESGTNSWIVFSDVANVGTFKGVINDVRDATEEGYYALVILWDKMMHKSKIPTPTTEERAVTPTKSTQTITPNNADYLSKVTVNPIPSSYVIPSGTVPTTITTNGTHNVSGYANVSVNVPIPEGYIQPSGALEITDNGEHDVTSYASVNVNIENKNEGLTLNGIIREYQVNAGATVNAGDFVEFIRNYSEGSFSSSTPTSIYAFKMSDDRVLVIYSTSDFIGYAANVLKFTSTSVTVGEEIRRVYSKFANFCATQLDESTFFVTYRSGDNDVYGRALFVDGMTMSTGNVLTISEVGTSGNVTTTSCVGLTENRLVVAYHRTYYTSQSVNFRLYNYDKINDTLTSLASLTPFKESTVIMKKLSEDSVLLIQNNSYAYVLVVGETSLAVGASISLSGCLNYVIVDSSRVLALKSNSATLLRISGSTITATDTLSIGSASTCASGAALSENRALVVYDRYARVLTLTDDAIIGCGQPFLFINASNTKNASVLAFSDSSAMVLHNYDGNATYQFLTIDGDTINGESKSATFVQPVTSDLHSVGVAKTAGVGGEMVEVYCVIKYRGIDLKLMGVTAGDYLGLMSELDSQDIVFTANRGYNLPATIKVWGATYTWNSASGMLNLSNPTSNVAVVINGNQIPLEAPVISIVDRTVTWESIENAFSYQVYGNGTLLTTITDTSIDLSSLALTVGDYTITVVAVGSPYANSVYSNEVIYTSTKLSAPTISLDGSVISITNNNDVSVRYNVYVDGEAWSATIVDATSVDLSTYALDAGTYSIYLTAFAEGYEESNQSNAVEYVVSDKITDLTGTTWYVPSGWSCDACTDVVSGSFNIYGSLNGITLYEKEGAGIVMIGSYQQSDGGWKPTANTISYNIPSDTTYSNIVIDNTESFTLHITGGSAVKSSNLIAWLQEYGELQ